MKNTKRSLIIITFNYIANKEHYKTSLILISYAYFFSAIN